jgi:type 1 glutamine amidotransferase
VERCARRERVCAVTVNSLVDAARPAIAWVGAYFKEHPWTEPATVVVEDGSHPATAGLGDRFSLLEEFYTFRDNPRPRVHVLLRLDEASVGSAGGDFPLAWTQSYGRGRTYYNALGHFTSTWNDVRFQRQLAGAVRWAANRD